MRIVCSKILEQIKSHISGENFPKEQTIFYEKLHRISHEKFKF